MISPCERLHLSICPDCDQSGSTVNTECNTRAAIYTARRMGKETADMVRGDSVDHRLVQVVKQFCEMVDDEMKHRKFKQTNPGGQHVTHTGDLAGASPGVMSRLNWWVRNLRDALPKETP